MDTLTIGEAKSRLSEVVSRASAGERFLIRRRSRPVAVVLSPQELERLERSASAIGRLAEALGQDPEVLGRIDRGELHPAMAAFGLWREEEADDLETQIRAARKRKGRRSPPAL
jgi:prevent-host-death family protein